MMRLFHSLVMTQVVKNVKLANDKFRELGQRCPKCDFYSHFLNFNVFSTPIPPRAAPGAPFYLWTANENMLGS